MHGVPKHGCSSSCHAGDTSCRLYTLNSSERMKVAFDGAAKKLVILLRAALAAAVPTWQAPAKDKLVCTL